MCREPPLIVEEKRQGATVCVQIVADVRQSIKGGLIDQFEAGVARLVVAVVVGEALVRWEMEGGGEGSKDGLAGGVAAVAEMGEGGGVAFHRGRPLDQSCVHFVSSHLQIVCQCSTQGVKRWGKGNHTSKVSSQELVL